MANYAFASVTSAIAGVTTNIYTIGSSALNVGITSSLGTIPVGDLSLSITSAYPAVEPNRPVVGQLYPRFTK